MEKIMDLGDDAETSLILFLLKKKIPDFLTLAKTQRERGYSVFSDPVPHRARVNPWSRQAPWLPQQEHQQLEPGLRQASSHTSSSSAMNGI